MSAAPSTPDRLVAMVCRLIAERYPGAAFAYAAGSLIRGEGTPSSDLDLVVMFEHLPHAQRDSFVFDGIPVEACIHDPETLYYFMAEDDYRSGQPLMAHLVLGGIEIPRPTPSSAQIKCLAQDLLDRGPPPLCEPDVKWRRCTISDALDDLCDARNRSEAAAVCAGLYSRLADTYLRVRCQWSGNGKWIPRLLQKHDPAFAARFAAAFEAFWRDGQTAPIAAVAEETLKPCGGLFRFAEGHHVDAPAQCRKPVPATRESGNF